LWVRETRPYPKYRDRLHPFNEELVALTMTAKWKLFEGIKHTVWLLTFGCQSFVSNFMTGGRKGYSWGIFISTTYVPPSYGVSGGPGKEAFRCERSSPLPAGWASIWDWESFWISPSSLIIRRIRLDVMLSV